MSWMKSSDGISVLFLLANSFHLLSAVTSPISHELLQTDFFSCSPLFCDCSQWFLITGIGLGEIRGMFSAAHSLLDLRFTFYFPATREATFR